MSKIFSIFCSLLILVSSLGITISNHYCGNEFQKQSVLGIPIETNNASDASDEILKNNCCESNTENQECCSTERQIVEADIDLFKSSQKEIQVDFEYIAKQFQIILVSTPLTERVTDILHPFIDQDRQVLFQSFLC